MEDTRTRGRNLALLGLVLLVLPLYAASQDQLGFVTVLMAAVGVVLIGAGAVVMNRH